MNDKKKELLDICYKVCYHSTYLNKGETLKKIQLNVKEDIYEQYQELCREEGTSVAAEIRRFMRLQVEKKKKKQ